MSLQFFTSYVNLDEMINTRLLGHHIGLGTAGAARQWLLDPTGELSVIPGFTTYRNGPERTETDRNGPKRIGTDRNVLSVYRNGP